MKKLLLATVAVATLGLGAQAYAYGEKHSDKSKAEKSYADKKHKAGWGAKADIVDTAASKADFSTLVAAVKAADLVDALKGDGPFTVFAPTNEAFEKLPAGTLDNLLKPENKSQLQDILKYHVVPSKIKSKNIQAGTTEVETLQGNAVTVNASDAGVTVDGANVTKTDIYTSNGVIHVIDTVILPQ